MKLASMLAASSFSVATLIGCTPVQGPDDPQAPDEVTCSDLVCDPHATCDESSGTAVCGCATGFTGDGLTCADADECASATACGAESVCHDAVGSFSCAPISCVGVQAAKPGALDGDYTLYIDGDLAKPWVAYCADMQSSAPKEYLTLARTGSNFNYGEYAASGSGTTVRTSFSRVRIDPFKIEIDIDDTRFSTSTGALFHGAELVRSMPLGVAMSCSTSVAGTANVDLAGTPFGMATVWAPAGNLAAGTATMTGDTQSIAITGGGNCGWNGPINTPFNPFNPSVYAPQLKLVYKL